MAEGDVTMPGGILAAIGHPQKRTRDVVGFRLPTPEETQRLSLPEATTVGTLRRVGYGADGKPVRAMYCVLPGDRNELVYELDN
jgi:GntR family transcriptional regulator